MRTPDGTIMQSGLVARPGDYEHERLNHLVVGVILNVKFSDDPTNPSAIPTEDQRGSQVTCDVMALSHGNDNPWVIPDVVVTPSGPSGVDDFCEDIPRGSTLLIDGSKYDATLRGVDPQKLDGDWCVVGFIGGSIEHPVMLKWWPHPGNTRDPATAGFPVRSGEGQRNAGTLNQGRRSFRRYAGLKVTVTSKGSVWIDTNESNAEFQGAQGGPKRNARDEGGDLQVDMKKTRRLQVNFNPPVPLPKTEPSLPQANPPQGERQRETAKTSLTLDQDTIEMIAGKVAKILSNDQNIEIRAKTRVTARGEDATNNTLLGSDDPNACDHAVKGETHQTTFNNLVGVVNGLIGFVNGLTLPVSGGSAGPPSVPFPQTAQTMGAGDLSQAVMVKK